MKTPHDGDSPNAAVQRRGVRGLETDWADDPLLVWASASPGTARARGTGSADPVRGLLRSHRRLCESAVDPLEIAAGLETHGLTDRTAASFRHRDVFSLAEELYARTPREGDTHWRGERPTEATDRRVRGAVVRRWLLWLLPGALCGLTWAALGLLDAASGQTRLGAGALGACVVALAVAGCLRGIGLPVWGTVAGCWLVSGALWGEDMVRGAVAGGPDRAPGAVEWSVPLGLAFGVAVGLGCAHWFATRARSRLVTSRGLAEFATSVRQLLAWSVGLFLTLLTALWLAAHLLLTVLDGGRASAPSDGRGGATDVAARSATVAALVALGLLFFVALLLAAHGFPRAATAALAGAAVLEILALASVFAGRLPWLSWSARPVELLVTHAGEAAVPAVICAGAAVVSLGAATRLLAGASAHGRPWTAGVPRRT